MRNDPKPTELKQGDFAVGSKLLADFPYEFCALQSRLQDTQSRLFVDDANSPQVALLCSNDGKGIALIAGEPSLALRLFEFALFFALDSPLLQFVCLPSDDWRRPNEVYPETQFFELQRVSFTLGDTVRIEGWRQRIPDGFSIHSIDQDLAGQIQTGWSQWFPDSQKFASHGMGFCVLHDARVVSIAYGSPVSGSMEIVVETYKDFQRQGLATLCCAALIEDCLRKSITPVWNAGASHTQSTSVAKKLGFGNERHHWWLVRRK